MLATVEFDHQFGVGAEEVDEEAVNWCLPSKLPTVQPPIPKMRPEELFDFRLVSAQTSGSLNSIAQRPLTRLFEPTSARRGEGWGEGT